MSTLTDTATSKAKASSSDRIDHLYCCDENESLCGLDISDIPHLDVLPDLCVVCDDLIEQTCPDCGE